MPARLGYPLDYILEEAKRQMGGETHEEARKALDNYQEISTAAYEDYTGEGGELGKELFDQIAEIGLGALAWGAQTTELADTRVRVGLSEIEESPADRDIIVWRPRERVTGYMYQMEVSVNLSGITIKYDEPLVVMMFYSIRSTDLMPYGEALEVALSDFVEGAAPGGPYAGQQIFGAIMTGVYHFNPKR